ncbi:MAG: ParB/RepB/Spo0J family partition protein [Bacilli bacterium]
MKKESKNKLLNEHLSSLISKYSQSNVLDELAKAHGNLPIQALKIEEILDNQFVKKVTLPPFKLKIFIENYQHNILLEPLVVRAKGDKYEVIIGRKRLAAARLAKLPEIPVIIMNYNDEETLLILLAKVRDAQGSGVLELAYIFDHLHKQYGYSHQSLAKLAMTSRSQVTNILRLLKLSQPLLKALNYEELSFGHARALITVSEENALSYLRLITENKLSVREIETLLKAPNELGVTDQEYFYIKHKNKVTIIFKDEMMANQFIQKKLK